MKLKGSASFKVVIQTAKSDELIISKSKFIGYTLIGASREIFLKAIDNIFKNMPSADHIAFAYQIKTNHGIDLYFNDAGEPSGTAGRPLLNILEKKNIVNSGIAVVRFYGGVNLGTGGLARAYTQAGMLAITQTKFCPYIEKKLYLLSIKYNILDLISHVIYTNNGKIIDKVFSEKISLKVSLSEEAYKNIMNKFPTLSIIFVEDEG